MSDPYLGEIRLFPMGYAPKGWAQCNGQVLSIAQNQALFSLLGTTYGGNGTTTFALPNLQGNVCVGWGQGPGLDSVSLGQKGGEAAHTLTVNEMPAHIHQANGSSQTATAVSPENAVWATSTAPLQYGQAAALVAMNGSAITATGASQGHANVQPYLVVNFCIATAGIYPSRN